MVWSRCRGTDWVTPLGAEGREEVASRDDRAIDPINPPQNQNPPCFVAGQETRSRTQRASRAARISGMCDWGGQERVELARVLQGAEHGKVQPVEQRQNLVGGSSSGSSSAIWTSSPPVPWQWLALSPQVANSSPLRRLSHVTRSASTP